MTNIHSASSLVQEPTGGLTVESLPLWWFITEYDADTSTLDNLFERGIEECMRGKGFEYVAVEQTPTRRSSAGYYGVENETDAVNNGYARPDPSGEDDVPADPQPNPSGQFLIALNGSVEEQTMLNINDSDGTPVGQVTRFGGCTGRQVEAVYGSYDRYVEYLSVRSRLETVVNETIVRFDSSTEGQALNAAWSACMELSGFVFPSPEYTQFKAWPEPRPGVEERTTAVADVRCKDQTSYVVRRASLESDLQRSLLEEQPSLVVDYQRIVGSIIDAYR